MTIVINNKPSKTCIKCSAIFTGKGCKPCKARINTAWRAANPEEEKARKAAWRAANRERERIRSATYRAANVEKCRIAAAKYQSENLDAYRIIAQNKRARKRASGGKLSVGLSGKLFKLQKGKCACCKKPLGNKYHLDHIMPLILGGANEDWNIQLLTAACNQQKHVKHPVDFMQSRGFLI